MFGFLKNFFGDAQNDSQVHADAAHAMHDLDIDMAKAAHENWKYRLEAYLDGSSKEDLSAETICFDDRCDLGRWIHGPAQSRLGRFAGFTALVGNHKMFHYSASNVVSLTKAGKSAEARKILDGQFKSFSQAVMTDLDILQEVSSSHNATRRRA